MAAHFEERAAFAAGNAGQRPEGCEDAHLEYLDDLRESAITNMFGARPYLMAEFPDLERAQAAAILGYWLKMPRTGPR